jgi:hypothetical protein
LVRAILVQSTSKISRWLPLMNLIPCVTAHFHSLPPHYSLGFSRQSTHPQLLSFLTLGSKWSACGCPVTLAPSFLRVLLIEFPFVFLDQPSSKISRWLPLMDLIPCVTAHFHSLASATCRGHSGQMPPQQSTIPANSNHLPLHRIWPATWLLAFAPAHSPTHIARKSSFSPSNLFQYALSSPKMT